MDTKTPLYISSLALVTSASSTVYLVNEMNKVKADNEKLKKAMIKLASSVEQNPNMTALNDKIKSIETSIFPLVSDKGLKQNQGKYQRYTRVSSSDDEEDDEVVNSMKG